MRVLHVGLESPATRAGGLNRYLVDLVRAERTGGIDAEAVVLSVDGEALDEGVHAIEAKGPIWRRSLALNGALRALQPCDVADAHFAGTAAVPVLVGALRGVPTVVHFQGPWADESVAVGKGRINVAAKRAIERAVYRRAARFVVLSSAFASILEESYGIAPWAVDVVAPGVDLEVFSPGSKSAARDSLGLTGGHVVLSVRRLVPRMGLDVLVRAWADAAPGSDDCLVIVGEGSEAGALEAFARTLGVDATVQFRGRVSDSELVVLYRAADTTVVPSTALEGYGLVVLESLACGTPVIGTDAGGLGNALASLGQWPAVPAGDVDALAAALRAVLHSSGDLPDEASCRRQAESHSWASVAAQHEAIYERVVAGERPLRVVVLDHTAVLSGGELAIARAIDAVRGDAAVHAILATDGPFRARLECAGATVEILELDRATRSVRRGDVTASALRLRSVLATGAYVARLARRLRMLKPDVVHTNSLKAALYGGVAARLAGVPCVWHVRDRIEEPALPRSAVALVRAAARVLPSVVVANSASTLATLHVEGGIVIPSPLDPSISLDAERAPASGHLRVAVVGRLAEWKGQRLAIEAFDRAFHEGAATLDIVGAAMFDEGAYEAELHSLVDALGLHKRVEFLGFHDDIAGLLSGTDIVVHASLEPEPFGQVVIEAMGAGCAVVVADAGGPAEIVTDGVDGLVYARGDVIALTEALERLAADPDFRERLGTHARATAAAYAPDSLAPLLVGAWRGAVLASSARRPWRHRAR